MHVEASLPGRRPRPVAGLPAPTGVAVAKAWLLELLAHRPLDEVTAVPISRLAREAPALCDAVLAAVAGDAALGRLLPGGNLAALAAGAGALTGATVAADVVTGVDALRAVLHRALRTDGDAGLAADAGDRLAYVCAQVTAAALRGTPAPASASQAGQATSSPPQAPPEPGGRVFVAHDLRAEAPHLTAIGTLVAERGGEPVAVLAVEIDDRDRLASLDGEDEFAAALVPVEHALAAEARADGVLVRQGPGRWWLLAPGLDTDAARRLAHRVSATVGVHAPQRHGVSLRASIGVAVCPDDGTAAQALAGHADEGVFTARALGVSVA
jgi:GGDEF domain-containing protein